MGMDISRFTAAEVERAVTGKGYAWFTRGAYNVNIVGVRSFYRASGRFDDRIYVVYRDRADGPMLVKSWEATTDPGGYWLANPGRVEGTAILKEGQYRGCWKLGKHKGKYEALVQTEGAVTVYRDDDRDLELDIGPNIPTMTGWFGINIHKSSSWAKEVGKWSAGCQVFHYDDDYAEFMGIVKKAAAMWGNKFSYTLLNDGDFDA